MDGQKNEYKTNERSRLKSVRAEVFFIEGYTLDSHRFHLRDP